ncbi:MAG: hypothetical protein CML06_18160 [Pseudomonadales bacterium]|nr:hypothetical protein [Pseudomonadales bacterium]
MVFQQFVDQTLLILPVLTQLVIGFKQPKHTLQMHLTALESGQSSGVVMYRIYTWRVGGDSVTQRQRLGVAYREIVLEGCVG